MISRLLKIIGLFCKRALQKRPIFSKETCYFKEPTNRSNLIYKTTLHKKSLYPRNHCTHKPTVHTKPLYTQSYCTHKPNNTQNHSTKAPYTWDHHTQNPNLHTQKHYTPKTAIYRKSPYAQNNHPHRITMHAKPLCTHNEYTVSKQNRMV